MNHGAMTAVLDKVEFLAREKERLETALAGAKIILDAIDGREPGPELADGDEPPNDDAQLAASEAGLFQEAVRLRAENEELRNFLNASARTSGAAPRISLTAARLGEAMAPLREIANSSNLSAAQKSALETLLAIYEGVESEK